VFGGAVPIGDGSEGGGIGDAALAAGCDDMKLRAVLLRERLAGGGLPRRVREDGVRRDGQTGRSD
jgi:hypothetical protein